MYTTMPITQARVNLGAVVRNVNLKKEPVILNRDGYPVAAIINLERLEDMSDSLELTQAKNTTTEFTAWDEIKENYEL